MDKMEKLCQVNGRSSDNYKKPGRSFSVSLFPEWSPANDSIDIAFPSAGPESFPQVIQSITSTPSFESMFPSAMSPRAPLKALDPDECNKFLKRYHEDCNGSENHEEGSPKTAKLQ